MATHPSILAWEIPWTERTEEPGRLQSMGSQKSWYDLSDETTTVKTCGASFHTLITTSVPGLGDSQVVLVVKSLPASAGDVKDTGSILGSGRSPGGGSGNPLQDSCLENPTDRGAWRVAVRGVTKSRPPLSDYHTHALT